MLLTHTKLVLGNNITYMSAYNYFLAVPMVLLMELKIINDADKYLYLAKNDGRNRVRSNENRFTQSYNIM
jgi:hypothetical protein